MEIVKFGAWRDELSEFVENVDRVRDQEQDWGELGGVGVSF